MYFVVLFLIIEIFKTNQNLFFIYSIYGPFARLTAHLLFYYLSVFYVFKKEFIKVKFFWWLCGKKTVKQEAGANH